MIIPKRTLKQLLLNELYHEAGHTLQRSPALLFCLCFCLAYLIHSYSNSFLWLWSVLALSFFALSAYLFLRYRHRSSASYLPSILGYISLGAMLILLCGVRIELYSKTHESGTFTAKSTPTSAKIMATSLDSAAVDSEVIPLITGLSLGYIPNSREGRHARESFVHSGLAHLLAVSGFHLGVVVGLLHLFLFLLPIGRHGRWRRAIIILGAWGFVALTGWAVPTVRATLMLSLYLFGRIISRPIRFGQLLATSALIQFMYAPEIVQTKSFVLSYAAVIAIYLFYKPIFSLPGKLHQPILRWSWSALALTLSAQIGVLPICLYYFGSVSWSFLWLSLPTTLLSMALIPLSLIFLFMNAVNIDIYILPNLLNLLGKWLLTLTDIGSGIALLQQTAHPPLWSIVLWWVLLLIYALWQRSLITRKNL